MFFIDIRRSSINDVTQILMNLCSLSPLPHFQITRTFILSSKNAPPNTVTLFMNGPLKKYRAFKLKRSKVLIFSKPTFEQKLNYLRMSISGSPVEDSIFGRISFFIWRQLVGMFRQKTSHSFHLIVSNANQKRFFNLTKIRHFIKL